MMDDGTALTRRLWAHQQIRQLAYKYAYAVDFRDVPLYETLWAQHDPPAQPPEIDIHAARRMVEEWPDRGPSILFVCNHLISLEDETHASGTVYCLVQVGWGERFIDQSVLYQDRYIQEDDAWKFLIRRHLLWFGEERSTHPFRQEPAGWPVRPSGRGTLPEDVVSYREFQAATTNRGEERRP